MAFKEEEKLVPDEIIIVADPKSVESIQDEADRIFNSLLYEAINIPGDHGISHHEIPNAPPGSEEEIKKGKQFFYRNFFPCVWSIMVTELLQFPIQRITGFVTRNASYNGPDYAYKRGVSTYIHILKWMSGDVTNKMAKSSQDVLRIRKLHQRALVNLKNVPSPPVNKPKRDRLHILEAIRKDMADVPIPDYLPSIMTRYPSVPMSQFDMVIVHGVFFFFLDAAPERFGLYNMDGYESYIYYWSVIGRYLGIQDRFNLPLLDPAVRKAVCKRITEEILAPCYKAFDEKEFLNLSFFAENGWILNPFELAVHILVRNALNISPAANTKDHINLFYRFIYKLIRFAIWGSRYRPILTLMNFMSKVLLYLGIFMTRGRRTGNHSNLAGTGPGPGVGACPGMGMGMPGKPGKPGTCMFA